MQKNERKEKYLHAVISSNLTKHSKQQPNFIPL